MRRFRTITASLVAMAAASLSSQVGAEEGFYQFPAARGDVLVFASEGDLWRTGRSGGTAIRLTNHEEEESNPEISPDGMWVAFNAAYDSGDDIYVMPVAGGIPKRLTFEGAAVETVGWTPDGRVIFSKMEKGRQTETLYTVSPKGGHPQAIPLWRANDATYGSDGATLFFNRRGLGARASDNSILYRGGGMAQLWKWKDGSKAEATQLLADFGAPIRNPMAYGGRIYFISDKSGSDAVWSVSEDGSGAQQHSEGFSFPVLQATIDNGEIFLQNGADLHVFSTTTNSLRTLKINLITDREQTRLRTLENTLQNATGARISPDGKSVAVNARGRIALAAPKNLRRVEFATPLDSRAREAVAGPDGKWVYMILDKGMQGDIYRMAANGAGSPEPVTKGYSGRINSFDLSPDGKTIIILDQNEKMQKVDVATGRVTLLDAALRGNPGTFGDITFSPDSSHIAYSKANGGLGGGTREIYLQNLSTLERVQATSPKYLDYAPAFSSDGAWLYFISDRNFDPTPGSPWGERNMGVAFTKKGEIYALALDPAAEFPFREDNELTGSKSDSEEETAEDSSDDKSEDKRDDKPKDKKSAPIVFSGLSDRLYKVPAKPGAERDLFVTDKFIYTYVDGDVVSIKVDKSDAEQEVFAKGAMAFELSADRKTALVVMGSGLGPKLALVPADAKMPPKLDGKQVRLDDWKLTIDPVSEWKQMFADAWRMHRDFSYDPAMRGVDWNAVRTQHEPLLERIGHRAELNTILGQMAYQLGILHSQVRPGDLPSDGENGQMAFLGAEYTPVTGGLRIDRIFDAEADLVSMRPPLRHPGVDVREGDVIQSVDGRKIASLADLRLALTSKAGQEVLLDLSRGNATTQAIVKPMDFGGNFIAGYYDFVEGKKAETQRLSGGDIGYLHLRAMGSDDVASFARDFYSQLDKPGLIIDVRNNSGGNVDSIIINALMRKPWAYWSAPNGKGDVQTNMQNAYRGHVVVLIDERTYSDGETFAGAIKSLGLAPLVGKRTAGAGIWLGDRNRLVDNGAVRIAEFAQYDLEGNWIVEGYGVGPDYEIENDPYTRFNGEDAQLNAAIAMLEAKIASEPVKPLMPRPLYPLGTPARDVAPLK